METFEWNFDPNLFSGAGTYSVPIEIPTGRNGVQPNIGLTYNSLDSSAGSIVGYGWSLSEARIVRHTEESQLDLYDGDFLLEMEGGVTELVPISLSSGEYGTYGAEVEGDFLQVEFTTGDDWIVENKYGVTMLFGSGSGSRIDKPGDASTIYAWYIDEVRDLNDNYVEYEYYTDGAVLYPERISYTGHGTTDGPFEILFEPFATGTPSPRSDVYTTYDANFALTYQYLVDEIRIEVNNVEVGSYELSYATGDNGDRSLLESVTRHGKDANGDPIALEPWVFDYSSGTKSWTNVSSTFNFTDRDFSTQGTTLADYSGDGIVDLMYSRELSSLIQEMHQGGVDGFSNVSSSWTFLPVATHGLDTVVVDLNGDSAADLVRSYSSGNLNWVYFSDRENGFDQQTGWSVPSVSFDVVDVKFGDLNGDGITDIFRQRNCSGSCTVVVWIGDGSTGWTDETANYTLPAFEFNLHTRVVDVNRDGLDDLWKSYSGGGGYTKALYLNKGDGTFEDVTSTWSLPDVAFNLGSNPRITDVNGDGYLDVIEYNNVYIGHDSGWTQDTSYTSLPGATNAAAWAYMDFNGDGLSGIVRDGSTKLAYMRDGVIPDLLLSATGPQGGEMEFEYQTSAELTDLSGNALNPDLPYVFPVVTKITHDDGVGTPEEVTYSYAGGAYINSTIYDGRFAGFYKATKTFEDGSSEVSYFHQGGGTDGSALGEYSDHEDKLGRVFRTEWRDSAGDLLRAELTRFDRDDLGGGRAFVYPSRSLTLEYNDDGSHRDRGLEYTYDAIGNVTTTTDYGEVTATVSGGLTDTGSDLVVSEAEYVATTSPYLGGLVHVQRTLDDEDTVLQQSTYYYDGETDDSATVGNLTKQVDSIDGSTSRDTDFTYDTYGNRLTITDDNGNTTTYAYDSEDLYVVTTQDALLFETQTEFDLATGKQTSLIDPNGIKEEWDYDTFGRLEEHRRSSVSSSATMIPTESFVYTDGAVPNGVAHTIYDRYGESHTDYLYVDGFGRAIQSRSVMETGDYSVIDTTYDVEGRVIRQSLPYADSGSSYTSADLVQEAVETTNNRIGRVLATQDSVGTRAHTYEDWAETVIDEEGNEKVYAYDADGNLIQVDEVNGASTYVTSYTFDPLNRLTKIEDHLGNEREYCYDRLSRRTCMTAMHDPGVFTYGTTFYVYDGVGNLVETTDPNLVTTTYTYDDLNRILAEDADSQSGTEVSYVYDTALNGIHKIDEVTRGDVVTRFTYNERGDVATKGLSIGMSDYPDTAYTYDYQGRLVTTTYPDGTVLTHAFDAAGLIDGMTLDSTTVVSDVVYNANQQPTSVTYGNGTVTTNTYDQDERYWLQNRTTGNGTDTWQNLSYTYDNVGNIDVLTDSVNLSATSGSYVVDYTYDDLYRLTRAVSTGIGSPYSNYDQSFVYNAIGNMTTHPIHGTMTYGNGENVHALTGYGSVIWTYDDNGNVTSDGTNTLAWSYRNELLTSTDGVDSVAYRYDHSGDRIQKTVNGTDSTTYLGDYVITANGDTEHHLSLNGAPVFKRTDDGTTVTEEWIHTDHLGSVAVMTDDAGDLVSFKYYEPYGNVLVDEVIGTPPENRFDYTNKERDAETGLSYFEARYLSTDTGRFLSLDPWEGDYYDPQSLNKYAYARNNPVHYVDQTGKWYQAALQMFRAVIPYVRSLGIFSAEVALTTVDVHDYAKTVSNPNATSSDVLISQSALITGLASPGGGYSKVDDTVKVTSKVNASTYSSAARLSWVNPKKLDRAFGKHAGDFSVTSKEQYIQVATQFYDNASLAKSGYRKWVEANGRVRIYQKETNTFGVYTPEGTPITIYKPTSENYIWNQSQHWGKEQLEIN